MRLDVSKDRAFYLMGDDGDSGVVQVEPGGNLPVGDDEDVPHPGGVLLHRAQRVPELLVVLESAGGDVFILFGLRMRSREERTEPPTYLGFSKINLHGFHYLHLYILWHVRDRKEQSYLWDGGEVPEQVGGADG